jgi:hypothetical protein
LSDDFFEEEETPKVKRTSKKTAKKAVSEKAKKQSAEVQSVIPQQVDLTWTIALVVVAFVVGFLIRGLFIPAGASYRSPTQGFNPPGGGQYAPALTPEQMEKGELPAGHPPIGGTTQTPSPTTEKGAGKGKTGETETKPPETKK